MFKRDHKSSVKKIKLVNSKSGKIISEIAEIIRLINNDLNLPINNIGKVTISISQTNGMLSKVIFV